MSDSEFCIRLCKDGNTKKAQGLCQHIYDVMGTLSGLLIPRGRCGSIVQSGVFRLRVEYAR